jgi:hypothetical protein
MGGICAALTQVDESAQWRVQLNLMNIMCDQA